MRSKFRNYGIKKRISKDEKLAAIATSYWGIGGSNTTALCLALTPSTIRVQKGYSFKNLDKNCISYSSSRTCITVNAAKTSLISSDFRRVGVAELERGNLEEE